MLSTVLEKAEGLLSKRFIIAYWFPTFFVVVAALALRATVYSWEASWAWWLGLAIGEDKTGQAWALLAFLMLITLFAYLMQPFTRPLVQFFEGYLWPPFLRHWRTKHQEKRYHRWLKRAKVSDEIKRAQAEDQLFYGFPLKGLLPTRLGNTIRAAEGYGDAVYGMDLPFWWARLWPLLPESEREAISDALTVLVALLHLATLLIVAAVDGAIYFALCKTNVRFLWWLPLVGGIGLAYFAYIAAVVQARSYGQHLRVSVDLHRFDVLKELRVALPETPQAERNLWAETREWLYGYNLGFAHQVTYLHPDGTKPKEDKKEDEPAKTWWEKFLTFLGLPVDKSES
jgi:hypothetical protein